MPRGNKPGEPLKYRNISVDADIVDIINQTAQELQGKFGFKPTISQTLRHLLNKGATQ
jgi:hypothetical protein